jgi:hypothetical protein
VIRPALVAAATLVLAGAPDRAAASRTPGGYVERIVRPTAPATGAVPVTVGANGPELDACSSSGRPKGLNPRGDNFLAVKAGPSLAAARTDRLRPGQPFFICGERGGWTAIVYAPGENLPARCGVSWPAPRPKAYAGPCRSGWVFSRYVEWVSG